MVPTMPGYSKVNNPIGSRPWMGETVRGLRFLVGIGLPLLLFFVILVIVFNVLLPRYLSPTSIFEAPLLLLLTNTIFGIISFVVALIALRAYIADVSVNLLFFGCGMLSLSLACFITGWLGAQAQANANLTIHNTGILLASLFNLLAGATMYLRRSAREDVEKQKNNAGIFAYVGILIFTAGLSFAALRGYTPAFSIPGSGSTLLREVILTAATIFFGVSCLLIAVFDRDRRSFFLTCYAVALALITVSLIALMTSKWANSPLSWLGRSAQFAAGIYFLAAVVAAVRAAWTNRWTVPDTIRDYLRPSEALYRDLVETATDAIIPISTSGEIFLWNTAAEKIFGYNRMEAWRLVPSDLIDPEDSKRMFQEIEAGMAGGKRSYVGTLREVKARKKGGDEFPAELSFSSRRSGGGWISTLIIRDITERKRAEEALRENEVKYRSLFEHMLDGFAYCQMLFDEHSRPEDFVYLAVNNAFGRLTGLKDVVGKRVTEVIPRIKELNPELFEIYGRVALTGNPERFEIDFKPLGLYLSVSVYSPAKEYFVAVFDDITERKQAEEALQKRTLELEHLTATLEERVKERTAELADLSSQLVSAQENERKRVSYDLHDSVWQMLLAIRFNIESLFSSREDWEALGRKSKEVMDDILATVGKIRSMQGDLWPYVLDDIGMRATIDWYCREFEKGHSGLSIESHVNVGEHEVPSSAKIVIYRVMQEAMSNVAKHSRANHLSLSLINKDHRVEFTIEDNGIGFDPMEMMTKKTLWGGLGLLTIKARTELSGGIFGVESVKGKGTTVRASWPCD